MPKELFWMSNLLLVFFIGEHDGEVTFGALQSPLL